MAERRMFAKTIIDSDSFLDMPQSSQNLYFHLCMRADDEGFINNPKKIQRMVGCSQDDLTLLIAKNFIIPFESGVVVIKHWLIHNIIRMDRLKPTVYEEEKSMLEVKKNGAYTFVDDNCQPIDNQMSTKCPHKLIEDKLSKDKLSKDNKPIRHKYGEYANVLLSDEELQKFQAECPSWKDYIEKLSSYMASTGKTYKSHLATLRNWYRKDGTKNIPEKQTNTSYDLDAWKNDSINKPLVYKKKK